MGVEEEARGLGPSECGGPGSPGAPASVEHRDIQMWAGPALGSWDPVALKGPLGIYGGFRAPTELSRALGSWDRCRLTPACPVDMRQEGDGGGARLGLCSWLTHWESKAATQSLTGSYYVPGSVPGTGLWEGQSHTSPDTAALPFLMGSQTPQPGLWGQRPEGSEGISMSGGGGERASDGPRYSHVAGWPWPSSSAPFAWAQRP